MSVKMFYLKTLTSKWMILLFLFTTFNYFTHKGIWDKSRKTKILYKWQILSSQENCMETKKTKTLW